ncbi:MAG: hypothetical protein ACPG5Z_16330 [Pseudoalteromonas sp.]
MELTTQELKLILKNMSGFTSAEAMIVCSKINAEIERREELESLEFDDCESCKL